MGDELIVAIDELANKKNYPIHEYFLSNLWYGNWEQNQCDNIKKSWVASSFPRVVLYQGESWAKSPILTTFLVTLFSSSETSRSWIMSLYFLLSLWPIFICLIFRKSYLRFQSSWDPQVGSEWICAVSNVDRETETLFCVTFPLRPTHIVGLSQHQSYSIYNIW